MFYGEIPNMSNFLKSLAFLTILGFSGVASAAPEFNLTIKNHKFEPSEIVVPANTKVKLVVKNMDDTAEEFESEELDREKIVAAGSTVVIFIGPLKPGVYPFVGEFNPDTAKGQITAK